MMVILTLCLTRRLMSFVILASLMSWRLVVSMPGGPCLWRDAST